MCKTEIHSEKGDYRNNPNIRDVALYFLSKRPMSHAKLQRLCFLAQCLQLNSAGGPLFPNRFEAWMNGPVSPDLYSVYKEYGWCQIEKADSARIPESVRAYQSVLEFVYDTYGSLTECELNHITQGSKAWKTAREGMSATEYGRNPMSFSDMSVSFTFPRRKNIDVIRSLPPEKLAELLVKEEEDHDLWDDVCTYATYITSDGLIYSVRDEALKHEIWWLEQVADEKRN